MITYLQTHLKTIRQTLLMVLVVLNTMSSALSQDQPITTRGRITTSESKGSGLPGVNVLIKGTTTGTVTDLEGNFSLSVPANATLVISSIGFGTVELPVNGKTTIDFALSPESSQLEEIVVVGYGTSERKNLIGSVSKIDPVETKNIPAGSFDSQLQGKIPGVQISTNTGVPGEAINIRVRGATSINADTDPLYVVDGVFINGNSLQTIGTGGKATSPIADINPSDIESIEILKDAEATALYGSRGANGVILVTTKRGEFEQKPTIHFDASHGWNKAAKLWDLTTGPEHATLVNEWWINTGKDDPSLNRTFTNRPFRPVSEVIAGVAGRGLPEEQQTYDRLSQVFRTAQLSNYDLSLSGGTRSTKYYIAGGYNKQESILRPIDFERASFKINLDQKVNDKVQVGVSNAFTRSYRNQGRAGDGPAGGLLQAALHTPTYLSPVNEQGVPVGRAGFDNVELLINNYNVHTVSLRYIGNLYAEAELLPGLKFRTSVGADYNNYDESEYWNTYLISGSPSGLATSSITQFTTLLNEQLLTYRKKIDNHGFGLLVGNSLQSDVNARTFAQGTGFPNNSFTQISSAANTSSGQTWTKSTLASFFSKMDYNYSDKYLVNFSIRADGSSKFGANHKWGYFPAVGAAWRIKKEHFLQDVGAISDLKIRASYGLTGNQGGINNFAAQGLWQGGTGYQGNPGVSPSQLSNPDLKWETTRQTNIGVDLGVLNNRIKVEFNVYDKYTSDGLLSLSLGATSGFSTVSSNAAEISNKGFEWGINTVNIQNSEFTWSSHFNVAQNKNKIEKLPYPSRYGSRDLILQQEGSPLYSFWVYNQLYVDPQTGNVVYEDVKNDGKITADDRHIMGSIWPKFFGGFTNNITYKGFDASLFFSFQYGNKIYNHNRFFGEGGGARDAARVIFASNLARWQQPGDITDVPRPDGVNVNNYRDGGSRWLEDGSFLRLRSLNIGYTLPSEVVHRLRLETLRVYVVGTNLWTLTNYTGLDPESSSSSGQNEQGIDLGTPPQPRGIQVGIEIKL